MRIDRRLVLIGIMLVVLSMTMATQYATTRISYSFAIVHPSNADIRFIGSDNSSDDNMRALRVTSNATPYLEIELGDWFPASTKNYTAVFGIVNEEDFPVNITHLNFSGTGSTGEEYIDVWLHGDRSADYNGDVADSVIKVIDDGVSLFGGSNSVVWTLGRGDGDVTTMTADNITQLDNNWDQTSAVRYSINDANDSVNETSDFVWVGISLEIPASAGTATPSGQLFINFKAN